MKSDPLPIQTENFLLRIGQDTHRGVRNKPNEDRATVFAARSTRPGGPPLATVAIVADGVTSSSGGGEAAEIALQVLRQELDGRSDTLGIRQLEDAVQRANRTIVDRAKDNPALHNMTTTLVLAALTGDQLAIAHVGDSRAYLVREESIYRLTVDHTWVQEALDVGRLTLEAAKTHENRHVIRRCLGLDRWVDVDCKVIQPGSDRGKGVRSLVDTITIQTGDYILLCSDGLTDKITDEELKQIILQQKRRGQSPQKIIHALIQEALQRQEADNITVILIETADVKSAQSPVWPLSALRMAYIVPALILIVAAGLGWRLMTGSGAAQQELPPQAIVAPTTQADQGQTEQTESEEDAAVETLQGENATAETGQPEPESATATQNPESASPTAAAHEEQTATTDPTVADETVNTSAAPVSETESDTETTTDSTVEASIESESSAETALPSTAAPTLAEFSSIVPLTNTTVATATATTTATTEAAASAETATATAILAPTATFVPTNTPTAIPTSTMRPTSTPIPTATPTNTPLPTPTFTRVPPTFTPTPVPPTETPTEEPTPTYEPPPDDDDDDGGSSGGGF